MTSEFTIGQLAEASGCKVPLIRHYEKIGLLAVPARTAGGQRRYPRETANRLRFIRHSRELGFSLGAIRELLSLSQQPAQSCAEADRIARAQLIEVEQRLAQLRGLRRELKRMVEHCAGGTIADCRVIDVLADHRLCRTKKH